MTVKSSQFHGSRRKVKSSKQKPLAIIFISDSKVYIPVKVYLGTSVQKELVSFPLWSVSFLSLSPRTRWILKKNVGRVILFSQEFDITLNSCLISWQVKNCLWSAIRAVWAWHGTWMYAAIDRNILQLTSMNRDSGELSSKFTKFSKQQHWWKTKWFSF